MKNKFIYKIFSKNCIYTARGKAALLGHTPEREQAVKEVTFLLNIQNETEGKAAMKSLQCTSHSGHTEALRLRS